MRRRTKLLITAVLVLTVFLLSKQVFSYDTNVAHPYLTEKAINIYNSHFSNKISDNDKQNIVQGAIDEDTPIRWMNHFFEPNQNVGLLGFQTAKNWAQNGGSQEVYAIGDQSWQTAIDAYGNGENKKAFLALGHTLHLIEDMTVPAHTRLDVHVFNGGDPYEQWVKNNQPSAEVKQINYFSDLNKYFQDLANFSNNNFFSEDTIGINSTEYFVRKLSGGNKIKCLKGELDKNIFCLLRCDTDYFKGEVCKIDNTVNSDYFSILAPKAVSYGAGVIQLFFEQGEKLRADKAAAQKNLFRKFLESLNLFVLNNGKIVSVADLSNGPRLPQSTPLATIQSAKPTPKAPRAPQTPQHENTITPKHDSTVPFSSSSSIPSPPPPIPSSTTTEDGIGGYPIDDELPSSTFDYNGFFGTPPTVIITPTATPPAEPWPTPTTDPIFSDLLYTSSSPTRIFGVCATNTQSILVFHDTVATTSPAIFVPITATVSNTTWSAEVAPTYNTNFFYVSALGPPDTATSSLSEPVEIIYDNIAPTTTAFTSAITATSTTSSIIHLEFSATDELSPPALYDLENLSPSGTEWASLLRQSASTSYDFIATSSGDYSFRLRASDALGNFSDWTTTTITAAITPEVFVYNYLDGTQTDAEVTLTKDGSPYILKTYTVPLGKTLRIEAGTVIKGFSQTSLLDIHGSLSVAGTAEDRVIFTSVQDRSFTSTRLNAADLGSANSPQPWDWVGVWFDYVSWTDPGGSGTINHTDFRYSGSDPYLCAAAVATCGAFSRTIYLDAATLIADDISFVDSGLNIFYSEEGSSLTLSNSTLDGALNPLSDYDPTDYGIYMKTGSLNLSAVNFQNLPYGIASVSRSSNWPSITVDAGFSSANFINVDTPVSPAGMLAL
ncbi:MAG: hypothetical protein PHD72_02435 [Patescibacteria group bacterium]|nr:hypothetical protein [Patescibacteria group bacterium]